MTSPPPQSSGSTEPTEPTGSTDHFDLCSLEDLKAKGALSFDFVHSRLGRHEIAVFWDGVDVFALDNYCTHEGAMLSYGDIGPGEVICALHSAVFSLKTGACLDGFTSDTVAYEAAVRDGRVWVIAPGETRAQPLTHTG